MKDYIIVTDSTADLSSEQIKELDLVVIPLRFCINGTEYDDRADLSEISSKDFYQMLRDGNSSTTSQVTPAKFTESVEPILNEGKDVLYISFSSALSGTFSSALTATEELKEKYPDNKIIVIDSLSACMGQGLLVYLAAMKKRDGYNIDDLAEWIEKEKSHLCHWFTVDDLQHLKRGGRISAMTALLGTTLSIKPVMHVDDEGRLIPVKKVRGRRQSLDEIVNIMEEKAINPTEQTVFIAHADCQEDAEYTANKINEKLKVKNIVINPIGPVIGSHTGMGTIAVFYWGTSR